MAALTELKPPAAEPLSAAELRAHLRLAANAEEEALLLELLAAARGFVQAEAGLCLIERELRLTLDRWPAGGTVSLPRHPVRAVLAVTVGGADAPSEALAPDRYAADTLSRPARMVGRCRRWSGRRCWCWRPAGTSAAPSIRRRATPPKASRRLWRRFWPASGCGGSSGAPLCRPRPAATKA